MILTPFRLEIKSAYFREDRWILFDIQEYRQLEQGEIKREIAEALDGQWQKAIDEYWRRCEIALDWSRRAKSVKDDRETAKRLGSDLHLKDTRTALAGLLEAFGERLSLRTSRDALLS